MSIRGKWVSVVLVGALAAFAASCGGGGGGGGLDGKFAAGDLGLIDISVADFDGVALNEIIVFEFSEDLQADSVRPDTIQIREGPSWGVQVDGDFLIEGNKAWFYPRLPRLPANSIEGGEVWYAGLKPDLTYQITLPGTPKVSVVRNFNDDPLVKTFTERFKTALDGDPGLYIDNFLDPLPAQVRFSNPVDGAVDVAANTPLTITFNRRPLNPLTVSSNNISLQMTHRHGTLLTRPRSIAVQPILDQAFDRVSLEVVPLFPLADDAIYHLVVQRLEDLLGNDVAYFSVDFTVRNEDWRDDEFVLTFNEYEKTTYMDDGNTTASWNLAVTDALAALFTAAGGSGISGDLMPLPGENMEIRADSPGMTGLETETDAFGVTYDVFNFRKFIVPGGTTVAFKQRSSGPNRPVKILSLFPMQIDGTLNFSGGDGIDSETHTSSSSLPFGAGGEAGPGGGDGADRHQWADMPSWPPSPVTSPPSRYNPDPQNGETYMSPYGGIGGTGGDEGTYRYSYRASSTYYYYYFYSYTGGGGGGGGGRTEGTAGKRGGYSSSAYRGNGGPGGAARPGNLEREPNVGGGGGAAGGLHFYMYLRHRSYSASVYNRNTYATGPATGGGAGAGVLLQCAAAINVGSTGVIIADGGDGGDIKAYRYGGAGGGAAGGSIKAASAGGINLAPGATISVAGGTGGIYNVTYTYYRGGQGGNGGQGWLRFQCPQLTDIQGVGGANLTYPSPSLGTFNPLGGGAPSVAQTEFINLGIFDPEFKDWDANDRSENREDATIEYWVQMATEHPTNFGEPDLSALNPDDTSSDLTRVSEWTRLDETFADLVNLNGNHYQFVRIRVLFQLKPLQEFTDPLPSVDWIRVRFRY